MSMVGTFLVRSGDSDVRPRLCRRSDPGRIHPCAAGHLRRPRRSSCSRCAPAHCAKVRRSNWSAARAGIVVNNLLLTVILGIVFIGTLYPLIARSGQRREIVRRRALFQRGRRAARDPARHPACGRSVVELAAAKTADPPQARASGACSQRRRWSSPFSRFRRPVSLSKFGLGTRRGADPGGDHSADRPQSACARRSRPGAWRSLTSARRSRSPAWRPTALSRRRS